MEFVDFEAVVTSNNEVGSEDEVSDADSLKFLMMTKQRSTRTEHIFVILRTLLSR